MKWLEIIKVRMAGTGEAEAVSGMLEQVAGMLKTAPGLKRSGIYTHASVPGDLMITLTWGKEPLPPFGSDLANSLSHELKRHGLVDHSVWSER
ncbi:hypothetical protein DENIS_4632 [Desulfonema ishimotonii]|uniref:ABM domain-containing protein n=1 Tax=Desulfonema ishimotonii TaxID=45657 RepID=A0A401G336_9BACT|nr:hypothetical protein [Desulfonema ishimotonii]GBC63634.1 hypothetical protein DENIS_4632 [Desulfonema ishimotonii]